MAGVVMQRPNDLGRWYRCRVQQRGRQGQQASYTDGEHRVTARQEHGRRQTPP